MENEIEKVQCKDAYMCLCRVRYVLTLKVRPYTYERVLCSVRTRSSRRQAAQRKIVPRMLFRFFPLSPPPSFLFSRNDHLCAKKNTEEEKERLREALFPP
jgi:hypothetical protein